MSATRPRIVELVDAIPTRDPRAERQVDYD